MPPAERCLHQKPHDNQSRSRFFLDRREHRPCQRSKKTGCLHQSARLRVAFPAALPEGRSGKAPLE